MARINPVLNLNKTPQSVENTSLIFAKNIKLLPTKDITKDDSLVQIPVIEDTIVGKIVGINAKVYFFTQTNKIFEYDELTNVCIELETVWTYNNGIITGCVTSNNTGESILTICESDADIDVPIKHINVTKNIDNSLKYIVTDESLYTQAPNIPITNLNFINYYLNTIPAGVYQFFIRYKIRDEFYTNWFLASQELYAGYVEDIHTIQGGLTFLNKHKDSNESFVLQYEHLYPEYINNYEGFQIGFILSHDNTSVARSWKTFKFNETHVNNIYFDYNQEDIKEIDINDLTKFNYDIYNVKNCAFHKNRLYISNYKETDFNPNLAPTCSIGLQTKFLIFDKSYTLCGDVITKNIGTSQYYTNVDDKLIADCLLSAKYSVIEKEEVIVDRLLQNTQMSIEERSLYPNSFKKGITELAQLYLTNTTNSNPYYIHLVRDDNDNIADENNPLPMFNPRHSGDIESTRQEITTDYIIHYIYNNLVKPKILGIKNVGTTFWYKDNNDIEYSLNTIVIKYSKTINVLPSTNNTFNVTKKIGIITITPRLRELPKNIYPVYKNYKSLLPFTNYDFYIHFVDKKGIKTNGYKIGSKNYIPAETASYRYVESTAYNFAAGSNPNIYTPELHPDRKEYIIDSSDFDGVTKFPLYLIGMKATTASVPTATVNSANYFIALTQSANIGNNDPVTYIGITVFEKVASKINLVTYPTFTGITIPSGYDAAFISCHRENNQVCQLFNISSEDVDSNTVIVKAYCLECDLILYASLEYITILDDNGNTITDEAKYYPSGTTNPLTAFGDTGYIEFTVTPEAKRNFTDRLWIVGNRNAETDDEKQLIKLTPYITDYIYNEYEQLNLPGFLCNVKKLEKGLSIYVSGNDVYNVDRTTNNLNLTENTQPQENIDSDSEYILSYYNLRYMSLTQDIKPQIRRYNVVTVVDNGTTETTQEETSDNQIINAVNSMIASSIYELQSTYKDFIRKYYSVISTKKIIEFNNTVRSSDINVDERYRSVYKFNATDYYNVPTNRGIIINLFSLANTIYVHCEHALFKFSDNQNLNADDKVITLQESNVFDIGIQDIFDDQYGFAGLSDKKHSLITHDSYIFYDKLAKRIYAYGGNSEIVVLSDKIEKVINWINPTDILFTADNANNRFFINLRHYDNAWENICLSYSFVSKGFVAIHDIDFDDAFNSRINCYFQNGNVVDKINTNDTGNIINYSNALKQSKYTITDIDSETTLNTTTNITEVASCVDIICNSNYEKVKVLNWINWICNAITNFSESSPINLAEENIEKYSGNKIRIYSDTCSTDLIDLYDEANNKPFESNVSVNNYTYPRYNCGIWSMNYFRNILNRTDIFNYNTKVPLPNSRDLRQEDSLIYGKYFVIRFVFKNKNFKLENVIFNMNDYEKV